MHKVIYASGFLYHPSTQQILLHQKDNTKDDTPITLFSGKCREDENTRAVFQKLIQKTLQIKIPLNAIHPVYDYAQDETEGNNYVSYAEIGDSMLKKLQKSKTVRLFPLKKLPKLKLTEQARQDIIVGQRVINLVERQRLEENGQKEA